MNYLVIVEGSSKKGFSAYSPDINVFATGKSERQVRLRMAAGIKGHIRWLRSTGDRVPRPKTKAYIQPVDP
jgi:predicted RNase H-like HicB family nuclease